MINMFFENNMYLPVLFYVLPRTSYMCISYCILSDKVMMDQQETRVIIFILGNNDINQVEMVKPRQLRLCY